MSFSLSKKYGKSLVAQFILALLLATGALLLSWIITKRTFNKVLRTTHQLAEPNPKLQLMNELFRDIVKLDQLQRAQALEFAKKTPNPFLKESFEIQNRLDSLRILCANNEMQVLQIDSMKKILEERDKVFLNYLSLRRDYVFNDTLSRTIQEISVALKESRLGSDSSIVTTQKKITTTTIEDADEAETETEKISFWDKFLGRKKVQNKARAKRFVQEELNITIDTIAIAKEDSILMALGDAISRVEDKRLSQRERLRNRHAQLISTGNLLVSRFITMLQDIETEELAIAKTNNSHASILVYDSINKLQYVLWLFVAGTIVLIFLFATDITRSNRYRKELILAKLRAEKLEQVKHRFLSNMSHELRTPLQAIVGLAEQIKQKGSTTPGEAETLYQSATHLLYIVNEVLDYNRIISGKFIIEKKDFNMHALLQEVCDVMALHAQKRNLNYHVNIPDLADYWYTGDPFRLKQILYNVIGNAIKYTENGSVHFTVNTEIQDNITHFIFQIQDTGIGIAESDVERIFEEFEQVYIRPKEGAGLGLNIVKALVELQNGTISVQSEPGKGSLFTIGLSYVHAAIKPATSSVTLTHYKGMVWVIDDDPFVLNLCKTIFEKYHIPHAIFASGKDALLAKPAENLHMVLTDMRMPEMNGVEVYQALRQKLGKQIRIVALTAQVMPEDKARILQTGFDGLLPKPFLEDDLLKTIGIKITEDSNPSPNEYFDSSRLERMTYGDAQAMLSILRSFVKETKKDLQYLQLYTQSGNQQLLIEILHRLSGRLSQIGATALAQLFRQQEIDLRNGESVLPISVLADLQNRTQAFIHFIEEKTIPSILLSQQSVE